MDGGDDTSPRPAAASIVKVVKVTEVLVEMGSNNLTTDTASGVDGMYWHGSPAHMYTHT